MKISELKSKVASLYIARPLINMDELYEWAQSQGFKKTMPKENFHVTLAFCETPVNWGDFNTEENQLVCKDTEGRRVEPLGDTGAIVLMFKSDELQARFKELTDAGIKWPYKTYKPHVTISYGEKDLDLKEIKPFMGKLVFGKEEFQETKK